MAFFSCTRCLSFAAFALFLFSAFTLAAASQQYQGQVETIESLRDQVHLLLETRHKTDAADALDPMEAMSLEDVATAVSPQKSIVENNAAALLEAHQKFGMLFDRERVAIWLLPGNVFDQSAVGQRQCIRLRLSEEYMAGLKASASEENKKMVCAMEETLRAVKDHLSKTLPRA